MRPTAVARNVEADFGMHAMRICGFWGDIFEMTPSMNNELAFRKRLFFIITVIPKGVNLKQDYNFMLD